MAFNAVEGSAPKEMPAGNPSFLASCLPISIFSSFFTSTASSTGSILGTPVCIRAVVDAGDAIMSDRTRLRLFGVSLVSIDEH